MKNRQSGMSLLEILAAIAVGTTLFIGLTEMIDVSLEDARGQQAAHHQAQLVNAAQKYIAENYTDLMDKTAVGAVKAVNVADLRPFLPSGFANQNSYRQSTCVLVRQDAGKLNALVVTYDGIAIPDRSIAAVAMNAGQGAGYINKTNPGTARGPSWSMNTTPYRNIACAGGTVPLEGGEADAGHLVSNIFYDGPGQLSTDFLYRGPVPQGREELTRMNVPLQMGSAGLVDLGDSCSQTALAIESTTKDVVVCDSGKWRYTASSWKAPVNTYGALASVPKKDGDVRVTLNTGRAFVYDSGSDTWTALAVDENGDLNVPRDLDVARYMRVARDMRVSGTLTVEDTFTASGGATIEQTLTARGDIKAMGDVDIADKLIARGDIDARKNMDIDGYFRGKGEVHALWMGTTMIVIDGRHAAGLPCHQIVPLSGGGVAIQNPHGTLMMDSNAVLLNCTKENVFRYANGTNSP